MVSATQGMSVLGSIRSRLVDAGLNGGQVGTLEARVAALPETERTVALAALLERLKAFEKDYARLLAVVPEPSAEVQRALSQRADQVDLGFAFLEPTPDFFTHGAGKDALALLATQNDTWRAAQLAVFDFDLNPPPPFTWSGSEVLVNVTRGEADRLRGERGRAQAQMRTTVETLASGLGSAGLSPSEIGHIAWHLFDQLKRLGQEELIFAFVENAPPLTLTPSESRMMAQSLRLGETGDIYHAVPALLGAFPEDVRGPALEKLGGSWIVACEREAEWDAERRGYPGDVAGARTAAAREAQGAIDFIKRQIGLLPPR